ncbi:MAG: hypothetical protein RIM80_13750, partial [Alphaproteobacteria bacterium]
MRAERTAQHNVDWAKGTADQCDMTVAILWSRLGTSFKHDDGKTWRSGTEKEVHDALSRPAPELRVFRCTRAPPEGADEAQRAAAQDFAAGQDDGPIQSHIPYASVESFEIELRRQLTKWIWGEVDRMALAPWDAYRSRLIREVAERRLPLFDFGPDGPILTLRDVYTRVHAYVEEPSANDPKKCIRVGVDAEAEIMRWLDDRTGAPIRLISGEPGRGKSSFARMLAANLAEGAADKVHVIFATARDLDGWLDKKSVIDPAQAALTSKRGVRSPPLPAGSFE